MSTETSLAYCQSNLGYTRNGSLICCASDGCHFPEAKWHGKPGGYTNHLCRCPLCREAWRIYEANRNANNKRRARLVENGLTQNGLKRRNKFTPRPQMRGLQWPSMLQERVENNGNQ